jgi:hypothetical protein
VASRAYFVKLSSLVRHQIKNRLIPANQSRPRGFIRGQGSSKGSVGQAFKPDIGKNLQVIFYQTNGLPPRLVPKWHGCGVGDAFCRVLIKSQKQIPHG